MSQESVEKKKLKDQANAQLNRLKEKLQLGAHLNLFGTVLRLLENNPSEVEFNEIKPRIASVLAT